MKEKAYLELFRISDGKYIIGIFQNTITVYRQQMRALNIFDALVKENIIQLGSEFSIAVIGGGIAGLTFAAAALKSNVSVTLFEKEADYLHMQQGCDTRKIHPNIYDWPDQGSTFPSARLPVLSWTHDTASNVVKQIINGLSEIAEQIDKSEHPQGPALFTQYKNSEIHSIEEPTAKTAEKFTVIHSTPKIKCYADLIIYAVGYGVEKNLKESMTPSYWRNDALSQSILTDNHRFLVSGIGDGALIDLCRIKIRNYSYDRVLELMKKNERKYEALIFRLRDIKDRGRKSDPLPPDFYETEFGRLGENYYKYFFDEMSKDIVKENTVILNSKRPIEEILDFKKVSMLNALIVYLLKKYEHFEFLKGEMTFDDGKAYLNKVRFNDYTQLVVRHGTNILPVTDGMYLNEPEKMKLKALAETQANAPEFGNCWTFDSISKCFLAGSSNPDYAVLPYRKRSEFVTPDTKSICLSTAITLSKTLNRIVKGNKHVRLSLHRITNFDGQHYYQQITPYQGSKKAESTGCFGNVQKIEHGIVGQAILSGKPVLIKNTDEEEFKSLSKMLHLTKPRDHEVISKSFLAVPVIAPVKPEGLATNLVLFVDAEDVDFFEKDQVVNVILSSLHGLIDFIETMLESKMIYMAELEFDALPVAGIKPSEIVHSQCFIDIEGSGLFPIKTNLKFKEFYSFDIIYNK